MSFIIWSIQYAAYSMLKKIRHHSTLGSIIIVIIIIIIIIINIYYCCYCYFFDCLKEKGFTKSYFND